MRSNNHARSAVQSAPLTPAGVMVRLASKRRAIMVPQREAIGPVVRFNIWFRKAPSTLPKELVGNPPEASDKIPISFNDWRAEGGTSKRMANSGSSASSSSVAPSSSATEFAEVAPTGDAVLLGAGRAVTGVGGGAGSPKPSGSKDSGPCCPSAGKENTKTRALATKRPLFEILSVNDANLFPYLRATMRHVPLSSVAIAATLTRE